MASNLYPRFGKRILDALISLVGLLILSPVFAATAIAVRLNGPGPIFFRQWRTGQFGRPFRIIKFRTMRVASDHQGSLLTVAGDPRITPVGRWLRSRKIDELPQLLNVVAGEMSLVGPRPEVPRYTEKYSDQQRRLLSVKPGITSAHIDFDEEEALAKATDAEALYVTILLPAKLAADLAYCNHVSFLEDQRIVLQTVARVLRRFIDPRSRSTTSPSTDQAAQREDRNALQTAAASSDQK